MAWMDTLKEIGLGTLRAAFETPNRLEAPARNRRREARVPDGADTVVRTPDGRLHPAHILDVTGLGMRVTLEEPLAVGTRVACRVDLPVRAVFLEMRVAWERDTRHGVEYGLAHAPTVPGHDFHLRSYQQHVTRRMPLSA